MKKIKILSTLTAMTLVTAVFVSCARQTGSIDDTTIPNIEQTENQNDAWQYGEIVDENNVSNYKLEIINECNEFENYEKVHITAGALSVPSTTRSTTSTVEEVFTRDQLIQQIKTYSDIYEWNTDEIEMTDSKFSATLLTGNIVSTEILSNGKFHYFFLTSPDISTEKLTYINGVRIDKETNSLYISMSEQKRISYEEYLTPAQTDKIEAGCCWAYVYIEGDTNVENIYFIIDK
jgi:hypothetical protein